MSMIVSTTQLLASSAVCETLAVDGYIAQMFDPRVAQGYHVSLLKREPGQIQLQADVADTGAFLATPPPGPTSGQHDRDWIIDYAVRHTGPVIRQMIWAPKKSPDRLRWVDHEPLHPPIFFIHNNGRDLGLPLKDAAGGNCMHLRGAEEAAPIGSAAYAQIRINWCGYVYLNWNEQISTQKQNQSRETISLGTFAKHVAKKILKFMEFAKDKETRKDNDSDSDQRYPIGDQHITPRDIVLIGTVQVSHGSWMPILQLKN